MPRRRASLVACLPFVVALIAGCRGATTAPSPTPADFAGIVEQLSKAGIGVVNAVSGDAGCHDPALIPTAIAFDASGLDQTSPVRIYLYIFRDRDTWQRLAGSVATCARSYVTDPAAYESVSPSPFVASGQGPWGPRFAAALHAALTAAAGSGG